MVQTFRFHFAKRSITLAIQISNLRRETFDVPGNSIYRFTLRNILFPRSIISRYLMPQKASHINKYIYIYIYIYVNLYLYLFIIYMCIALAMCLFVCELLSCFYIFLYKLISMIIQALGPRAPPFWAPGSQLPFYRFWAIHWTHRFLGVRFLFFLTCGAPVLSFLLHFGSVVVQFCIPSLSPVVLSIFSEFIEFVDLGISKHYSFMKRKVVISVEPTDWDTNKSLSRCPMLVSFRRSFVLKL